MIFDKFDWTKEDKIYTECIITVYICDWSKIALYLKSEFKRG